MDEVFGLKTCDLDGYAGVFVKFKTSGYPFSLRQRWAEAPDDRAAVGLILPYVLEWNILDMDGKAIPLDAKRGSELLDSLGNVEDKLIIWLIGAFVNFWRRELAYPKKNSSPPSTET